VIVVDASAMLEVLLVTSKGLAVEERLFDPEESLHAPHLLDLEVAQICRRYCRLGDLTPERSEGALADLAALEIHRYPHDLFLPRVWELRHNFTAYDAAYVALAEALAAPLLTADGRMARASGHGAAIEVIAD
jgi:predicted nucleic acid-binding protein